jgi:DNA invertase Pin-like site-specific DNA recombinase
MNGNFIPYYRVSTEHQGANGLGIAGQSKAVADYLNGGRWKLIAEFTEVESGKRKDGPKLAEALAACKKHKARLVIAKLDRLARNVHLISGLMESKVDFVCCDMPDANRLTIHILAAVAEHEREMIAARTAAGLAQAKARGVVLGNAALANANRQAAAERAEALRPAFAELAHLSSRAAAAELNARAIETPNGAPWSGKTVIRVRDRLAATLAAATQPHRQREGATRQHGRPQHVGAPVPRRVRSGDQRSWRGE